MFARDRFEVLFQTMIHAGEKNAAWKAKKEPFTVKVMKRSQVCFMPSQNVLVDETIIGFKGRFNAYYVKSFGLVDNDKGYVIQLLVHFGSETSYSPD